MNILCLCPTYGRPRLVANAWACFAAQDYPRDKCKLVVLDDANQIAPGNYGNVTITSTPERYPDLPAKYNAMLTAEGVLDGRGPWDAVAVWDDDDIYLPWHLKASAAALKGCGGGVKPAHIWSLYNSKTPYLQDSSGRFHGSLVINAAYLRSIGGWVPTPRADFDQQMIRACGLLGDTLPFSPRHWPSYVYRWASTRAHHCSGLMKTPDDMTWYAKTPITEPGYVDHLAPALDEETDRIYDERGV
jgi:hypothetical protein